MKEGDNLKPKELKQTDIRLTSQNELKKSGVTNANIRKDIVAYAIRFEGNPYAWGGTSLTKGADCSGFAQTVFKDKGIKIPRTSRQQAAGGTKVAIANVKPADLIFYRKAAIINHVAIYIGGGKVISASSKKTGIRITKYDYRTPYKAVSYINDK